MSGLLKSIVTVRELIPAQADRPVQVPPCRKLDFGMNYEIPPNGGALVRHLAL